MAYGLACRRDPVKLGLKDANGKWDEGKFKLHVKKCRRCRILKGPDKGIILEIYKDKPLKKKGNPVKK